MLVMDLFNLGVALLITVSLLAFIVWCVHTMRKGLDASVEAGAE